MGGVQELRATPSCSKPFRASNRAYQAPWKSRKLDTPSFFELRCSLSAARGLFASAPQIPNHTASSRQNRAALQVPTSKPCLETRPVATTEWELTTPSRESPRTQKTVAFWGLHFGAGEPLSSSFLESHNLDAERPFLQQHAAGAPKCSQLMLALNTYSFQTIKLKLAAFLPSAAPTGEAPCGAHVFEGFSVSKMGP